MGQMIVSDHSIWLRHIEGDTSIASKVASLPPNAPITLQIDGRPVLFRKMRDGVDGRPTHGIRPDEAFKDYWNKLYQERRGQKIQITLDDTPSSDPYLASISALLAEWDSPEDNEAYNDL